MGVHHPRLACTRVSSGDNNKHKQQPSSGTCGHANKLPSRTGTCGRPASNSIPCICPKVCCNACVPALHVCCCNQVCSHSLLRTSALLCCALSPAHEMYAGCLGVSARGCAAGTRGAAREVVRLPAHRAWQAGHVWLWPARYERTRSMSTTAECRAHSAHADRQGRAAGRMGRGGSTARRGWTWAG